MIREPLLNGKKTCNKCHKSKPYISFSVSKHHKDGLSNTCRECDSSNPNRKKRKKKPHFISEF